MTDDVHQGVVMSSNLDTSPNGRIYYPGPGIVVTRDYIATIKTRYPIRELAVEDPRYFYAFPARAMALYCGLIELLLAGGAGALYGSANALLCLAGVIAAVGITCGILIDYRRNPQQMELTAWHKGRRVLLFASDDHRVFEQVRRAVVRALEANRRPRP
jgi:hypothetical protein